MGLQVITSHLFKSHINFQFFKTTFHQLTKPQTSQLDLRIKYLNEGGPFSNLRSVSLVSNDQEGYKYYPKFIGVCTQTRLKWRCCLKDTDYYATSKCDDTHLHHEEGHVTVSENHELMHTICPPCRRAERAKQEAEDGRSAHCCRQVCNPSTTCKGEEENGCRNGCSAYCCRQAYKPPKADKEGSLGRDLKVEII